MVKDGHCSERVLEEPESGVAGGRPIPRGVLASEAVKQDGEIGVISDESTVEVGKSKERLHVLDFARGGPVLNDFDLRIVHFEAFRTDNKAKEVRGIDAEVALFEFGEQIIQVEAAEDFLNMARMVGWIPRVDEYVV